MTKLRILSCLDIAVFVLVMCCFAGSPSAQDIVGGAGDSSANSNSRRAPSENSSRPARAKAAPKRTPRVRKTSPAKAATGTGTLGVAAEPRATIFVDPAGDGEGYEAQIPVGERLHVFNNLPAGRYVVSAQLEGYQTMEKEVLVIAQQAASVTLNLQPLRKPAKVAAPLTTASYGETGDGFARAGKWAEAEAEYRKALGLDPNNLEMIASLGQTLLKQKRWADAEAVFRQALKRDPSSAIRHLDLGDALLPQQKRTEAEAAYREAIRLDPNGPRGYGSLGYLLFQQKNFSEAEELFRRAAKLKPQDPKWHVNLGEAAAQQKKWAEAEAAYREAVKLEPAKALWRTLLAFSLYNLSDFPDAAAEYREANRLEPTNARSQFNLGMVYHAMGNKNAAIEQHEKLKALDANLASQLLSEISK